MNDPSSAPLNPPCSICGKPMVAEHKPFCSSRCALVDLNRWLGGNYAIPAVEPPDEDDLDLDPDRGGA